MCSNERIVLDYYIYRKNNISIMLLFRLVSDNLIRLESMIFHKDIPLVNIYICWIPTLEKDEYKIVAKEILKSLNKDIEKKINAAFKILKRMKKEKILDEIRKELEC